MWTKKRVVFIAAASLAFIAVGALIVSLVMYKGLNDSVSSAPVDKYSPHTSSQSSRHHSSPDSAKNYLIIGTDSRHPHDTSRNSDARSDTTIVAHVSQDGKRADLVSIPRDSLVTIPSCKLSHGSTPRERHAMFNSAFSKGDNLASSIACTKHTVEYNTDVSIDGFIVFDFKSFPKIVNMLGGVPMNIKHDMVSRDAHLHLHKGKQTLNGKEALGYVRARSFEQGGGAHRHGGDLGRIDRQHTFMKALIKEAKDQGIMSHLSPDTYSQLKTVLHETTVSDNLASLSKLNKLRNDISNVPQSNTNFYTVPTTESPTNPNRVEWTDKADTYWKHMRNDEPIR